MSRYLSFRLHFRQENTENETCVRAARVGGRGERTRADQSGGENTWRRGEGGGGDGVRWWKRDVAVGRGGEK